LTDNATKQEAENFSKYKNTLIFQTSESDNVG